MKDEEFQRNKNLKCALLISIYVFMGAFIKVFYSFLYNIWNEEV